jgi:hypothetical protein
MVDAAPLTYSPMALAVIALALTGVAWWADWTCDITGERGIELEAHHLSGWAGNPEKRFDLSNGVAISKEFHTLFHSKFYFGKVDNTPEQYAAFKEMIWAS